MVLKTPFGEADRPGCSLRTVRWGRRLNLTVRKIKSLREAESRAHDTEKGRKWPNGAFYLLFRLNRTFYGKVIAIDSSHHGIHFARPNSKCTIPKKTENPVKSSPISSITLFITNHSADKALRFYFGGTEPFMRESNSPLAGYSNYVISNHNSHTYNIFCQLCFKYK